MTFIKNNYIASGYTPPDDYEGGYCRVCDKPSYGDDICSSQCFDAFML
ncbi:hypothetical protein [uncultured Mediterranean phage uvMED]|nr:hypothetical protein [uncultured Mediterranean phage uvMED]